MTVRLLLLLTAGATIAALWGGATTQARAQDTVSLDLPTAIDRAWNASPAVEAAQADARRRSREATASSLTRLGRLTGVATVQRFQDPQIIRPIGQEMLGGGFGGLPFAQNQLHYGLAYELPLFLGGKLHARTQLAHREADIGVEQLRGTRWQVRFNTVSLYGAVLALNGAKTARSQLVDALEQMRRRLQLMVDQGKRPNLDLLKVEDSLAEARAELNEVVAQEVRAESLLAALLGYEPSTHLELAPLPEDEFSDLPAEDELDARVLESSVARTAALRRQEAGAKKTLARADFLPSIVAHAELFEHAADEINGPEETWQLRLAVQVPLFEGGARVARYGAAKAGERAAEKAQENTELRLKAEVRQAVAQLESARENLEAARHRNEAAAEAARVEQIRYDTGAGRIEDLLLARSRESAAIAEMARARGNLRTAAARINALVEEEVLR